MYVKKIVLLLSLFAFATTVAFAQDDELPPPSSKPGNTVENKNDQKPPDPKDFQGFQKKKKFDFSKVIIEPSFNFSISSNYLALGLSPYFGYRVFQPKNAKPRAGNVGLFVGGGITYRYDRITDKSTFGNSSIIYNVHTYGGGVLLQYNIFKGFFTRAKLELLGRKIPSTVDVYGSLSNPTFKVNYIHKFYPALLVGLGYNLLQSKNIFIPLVISYDVLHSAVGAQNSLYRTGFVFQLGFINIF